MDVYKGAGIFFMPSYIFRIFFSGKMIKEIPVANAFGCYTAAIATAFN